MNQLPAYLQNLPASGLAARAAEGIGSSLPPHISIRGNAFTLVDAAGNKQQAQTTYLDVCIADISDVMCKMYYGDENGPKKWTPDSDDPPACWSANGVAPSVDAMNPQAVRCDSCEWNKRGSAQSMEGKPTKACRDEKRFAVLIPGISFPLQLTLTPGSFTNFRGYTEKFKSQSIDMCHVFTRLAFEQGVNGILTFAVSPNGYIDEATANMFVRMKESKASDVLVGRNDRPRQAALPAPAAFSIAEIARVTTDTALQGGFGQAVQAAAQGFQPAPFAGAPSAESGTGPAASVPSATTTPAAGEPPRRRRRNAADNAAAGQPAANPAAQGFGVAPGAPNGGPAFGAAAPAAVAPFAQPTAAAQQAPFGIQTNAPPPPAGLDSALDALFKS